MWSKSGIRQGVFPVWFLLILAPILEELAWHGYGTDCLRSRMSLFKTSMLFAAYWAVWHFPLAGIKGYYHANVVSEGWFYSLNFIVSIFPFVFLMNWLYYKTNRNILVAIIFSHYGRLFQWNYLQLTLIASVYKQYYYLSYLSLLY